jgi:hypothetical protein
LQNRVTPFGDIVAMPERGTLMGNRGGRIHDRSRTLGARRWTSRRWIACELSYKGWQRAVMGEGYTELFFLDEVTALAAGHRPCFFCRRQEAKAFALAFAAGRSSATPADADAMDGALHAERLAGSAKRHHAMAFGELPDGAVIARGKAAFALRGSALLRWSPGGWHHAGARPPSGLADVLTPPAILRALAAGYRPRWHPSAEVVAGQ